MNYREANKDEHNIICRQVRHPHVLKACFMAIPIVATLIGVLLSGFVFFSSPNYFFVALFIVLLVAAAYLEALFIYVLINGMVKPIRCIDKHKYSVADCVVTDREQENKRDRPNFFITVSFPDGNEQKVRVSAGVYDLAEMGKPALLIKYDEPEGKKKLPFEIVVL